MTTTEEQQTRALEDSAMACIEASIPYWWVDMIDDGCGDAEYYVVRRADPWDETRMVLHSARCADYDAMVAECVRRNRAAVEGAGDGTA